MYKTIEIKDINELRNLLSENSTEPLVVDLKKEIYEPESNINIKRFLSTKRTKSV